MTNATITLNAADALADIYDARRTKFWVIFNTDSGRVTDADGVSRLGAGEALPDSAGIVTLTGIPVPSGSTNPTNFQVMVCYDAPAKASNQRDVKRERGDFGWMTVTGDANLKDLEAEQYAPPNYLVGVTGELAGYAADAEAARDAAVDISNISTPDSLVQALVKNTGGAGPLTSAALSASTAAAAAAKVAGELQPGGQIKTATDTSISAALTSRGCTLKKSTADPVGTFSGTLFFPAWDTEETDTDGFHDLITNPDRITIPNGMDGEYDITLRNVEFQSGQSAAGIIETAIVKGAANEYLGVDTKFVSTTAAVRESIVLPDVPLAGGDYVRIAIQQTSGGNRTLNKGIANDLTVGATRFGVRLKRLIPLPDVDAAAIYAHFKTPTTGLFATNAQTVTVAGSVVARGLKPAYGTVYNSLWVRDVAKAIEHDPTLVASSDRRQLVSYFLSRRSTTAAGVNNDTYADFVADHIDADGTIHYRGGGAASERPYMDGIHHVILIAYTDFKTTGSATAFTVNKAAIDACLAAIPRSGNGAVYSDPAHPSVGWGFMDSVLPTGDCAYMTALQARAYRQCADMAGENGSGPYTTLMNQAIAGLATLRQSSGWFKASSGNNAARDDVWATMLAVAENLFNSSTDRLASAATIRSAFIANTISKAGWFRHLPVGQSWAGNTGATGFYQDGGYWGTPVWDAYRSLSLVDAPLARTLRNQFLTTLNVQIALESTTPVGPLEWWITGTSSTAGGETETAALVNRFA